MSHFTKVRTQLRNLETVKKVLEELGYVVTEGPVRGHGAQQVRADLVVSTGTPYDIGFCREGQNIVMVADFWGLRLDREQFLHQVYQRYAYLTVVEQAQAQGWQSVTDERQPDGSIRLVMQRWE